LIRVSILGATGYSGGELIRLLLNHPAVKLHHLTSVSSVGKSIEEIHPLLRGRLSHRFESLNVKKVVRNSDVVFSCFPPTVGMKSTAQLVKAGVKVIDLSADYRLPTGELFKKVYKTTHAAPALLKQAVYGLPELYRKEISASTLVANPGCYATAGILAAIPLLHNHLIDPKSLILDAKSGVSGAGKKLAHNFLFGEVESNFQAYGVTSHRHQPEMETILTCVARKPSQITFTPHLVPMLRGILAVLYATLKKSTRTQDIHALYQKMYQGEPFVRVLPLGQMPQTKNVNNTNYCDIGLVQDERSKRIIVISAIDNLVKGAAGQAIQNMNILFNRSEWEGLQ
jgi:N-acetyl-gamma-glutamyl-phosphate reductase